MVCFLWVGSPRSFTYSESAFSRPIAFSRPFFFRSGMYGRRHWLYFFFFSLLTDLPLQDNTTRKTTDVFKNTGPTCMQT